MVSFEDRCFIFNLKLEELVRFLTELELDTDGTTMDLKRRAMALARHANEDQKKIILEWRIKTSEDSVIFVKWIDANSPEDNREIMESVKMPISENENENKENLKQFFRSASADIKEEWIHFAKDFCKTLSPALSPAHEEEMNQIPQVEIPEIRNEAMGPEISYRCSTQFPRMPERASLMDQVRKWSIRYSGDGSPQKAINFLDKVENMAKSYQITECQLLIAFPVLLLDKAETWYRCNREEWQNWEECKESFMLFFVPAKMRNQMIEEVKNCIQDNSQSVKDFIMEIQALMKFVPNLNKTERLDQIYKNMKSEYQLYIKRYIKLCQDS